MRVTAGAATDVGLVREGNEDSYLTEGPLFAVADGMGGHRGGNVASALALESLEALRKEPAEVDLPRLWSTLGVVPGRRGISFDDSAPEAALRREIAGPRPHATE